MKTVKQVRRDCPAVVTEIGLPEAQTRRLAAFGLVPGSTVCWRYQSPDRTLTALEVCGTVLAMRREMLAGIAVTAP